MRPAGRGTADRLLWALDVSLVHGDGRAPRTPARRRAVQAAPRVPLHRRLVEPARGRPPWDVSGSTTRGRPDSPATPWPSSRSCSSGRTTTTAWRPTPARRGTPSAWATRRGSGHAGGAAALGAPSLRAPRGRFAELGSSPRPSPDGFCTACPSSPASEPCASTMPPAPGHRGVLRTGACAPSTMRALDGPLSPFRPFGHAAGAPRPVRWARLPSPLRSHPPSAANAVSDEPAPGLTRTLRAARPSAPPCSGGWVSPRGAGTPLLYRRP